MEAACLEGGKAVLDGVVTAAKETRNAINAVREMRWTFQQFPQEVNDLEKQVEVVEQMARTAKVPTKPEAGKLLDNLKARVASTKQQLGKMKKKAKTWEAWNEWWDKANLAEKTVAAVGYGTIYTVYAAFWPRWKTRLPELKEGLQSALDAAQKGGAFIATKQTSRDLPDLYTRHQQLYQAVLDSLTEHKAVLISGEEGTGKAALALDVLLDVKAGKRLKGKFPDGVYDVVFGEFTGEQDMKQLISSRQKELLYCLTTEEVSVDDYVKNKLGDVLEGKQCLILLENVQDERIIQEFRFAGFNGALLVTGPQDVWPTAPSPLSVTPQHFLDALAPGKPSLAQNIVERYKKRMLKQGMPIPSSGVINLVIEASGGCAVALAALSKGLLYAWRLKEVPPATVQQAAFMAFNFARDHLPPNQLAAVQVLNALEPFRSGVLLPLQLVQLAVAVTTSKAFSSVDAHSLRGQLFALLNAGLIALCQTPGRLGVKLSGLAVQWLGTDQVRTSQRLFRVPPVAPEQPLPAAPVDEALQEQKLLLAAFLTSFGKTEVVAWCEAYLQAKLRPSVPDPGSLTNCCSRCLSDDEHAVKGLAERIYAGLQPLTARYVLAQSVQLRGQFFRQQGLAGKAKDDFERALKLYADQAPSSVYAWLGEAHRILGSINDAVKFLQCANSMTPDDAFTLRNLADALRLSNPPQLEAALQHLQQLIDSKAGSVFVYQTKGAVLIGMKQYQAAIQSLNTALATRGEDADVLAFRADAKLKLGDHKGAAADANAADALLRQKAGAQPNKRCLPETPKLVAALLKSLADSAAEQPAPGDAAAKAG